jgi:hypothetical protein
LHFEVEDFARASKSETTSTPVGLVRTGSGLYARWQSKLVVIVDAGDAGPSAAVELLLATAGFQIAWKEVFEAMAER